MRDQRGTIVCHLWPSKFVLTQREHYTFPRSIVAPSRESTWPAAGGGKETAARNRGTLVGWFGYRTSVRTWTIIYSPIPSARIREWDLQLEPEPLLRQDHTFTRTIAVNHVPCMVVFSPKPNFPPILLLVLLLLLQRCTLYDVTRSFVPWGACGKWKYCEQLVMGAFLLAGCIEIVYFRWTTPWDKLADAAVN